MEDFKKRVGVFLALVGSVTLLIFVYSDASGLTNFWLLLIGFPLAFFGFRLVFKTKTPPEKAERFRTWRQLSGKTPRPPREPKPPRKNKKKHKEDFEDLLDDDDFEGDFLDD